MFTSACPAVFVLSPVSKLAIYANLGWPFLLACCLMQRRMPSRSTPVVYSVVCTHLHFPALKFAACRDKALELQTTTSTQYLSLTCDGALITYYDHTNRNSLLPLSQQRSHHIHAGSDDHKVMLAVIRLRTSSPSWDVN